MKKIICSRCNKGVVAYMMTDKVLEIAKQDKRITIYGENFSVIATCPSSDCNQRIAIQCIDGKIKEEGLNLEEIKSRDEIERIKEEKKQKEEKEKKEQEEKTREEEKKKKEEEEKNKFIE